MKTLHESLRRDLDLLKESYSTYPHSDNFSNPEDFIEAVKQIPFEDLVKTMGNYGQYDQGLYPSGWSFIYPNVPYPGYLASALIKSTSAESLTDLSNIYYSSGKRVNSQEAHDIFAAHATSGQDTLLNQYIGSVGEKETINDPGFSGLMQNEPDLWQKIMDAQLSEKQYIELQRLMLQK